VKVTFVFSFIMYSVIVSFVLFQNHAGKILVRSCSFNLFF
jgi:hypothetical protein